MAPVVAEEIKPDVLVCFNMSDFGLTIIMKEIKVIASVPVSSFLYWKGRLFT